MTYKKYQKITSKGVKLFQMLFALIFLFSLLGVQPAEPVQAATTYTQVTNFEDKNNYLIIWNSGTALYAMSSRNTTVGCTTQLPAVEVTLTGGILSIVTAGFVEDDIVWFAEEGPNYNESTFPAYTLYNDHNEENSANGYLRRNSGSSGSDLRVAALDSEGTYSEWRFNGNVGTANRLMNTSSVGSTNYRYANGSATYFSRSTNGNNLQIWKQTTSGDTEITGVSITGTPTVGQTLTAALAPAGATATYKWQRADSSTGTFNDISSATGETYKLTADDIDKYIRVVATGSGSYEGSTVTSTAVGPVEDPSTTDTIYRLTDTLTAGKKYLVVSQSDAGTGYILAHNNITGDDKHVSVLVTIQSDTSGIFIEDNPALTNGVWTAVADTNGFQLKNGSYYIVAATGDSIFQIMNAAYTQSWNYDNDSRSSTGVNELWMAGTYDHIAHFNPSTKEFYSKHHQNVEADQLAYIYVEEEGIVDPTISTSVNSLSGFSTPLGTPSAAQSYTVSGKNLTADIIITAPAGSQIALAAGGPYGESINLSPTNGTVVATSIYVQLTGATAGLFSGTITHTSTDATQKDVVVSGTVTVVLIDLDSVSITGEPTVGQTLSVATLLPSGAAANYQWQWAATSGGTYTNISGATESTYVLKEADLERYIRLQATGTGSYTGTVTSNVIGPVVDLPIPTYQYFMPLFMNH
ncbi:MAG: hypothetical protein GX142_09120 [Chloroflexi bacterium]|nr:hypothetical protein [Chloroflexota bacterium]